jgi:hypothetical protein
VSAKFPIAETLDVQLPGCRFIAEHVINFLHYPLCPLNSRRYQVFGARTRVTIAQILGYLKMTSDKDSYDDCKNPFAALVRAG